MVDAPAPGRIRGIAFGSFLLVGWSSLLVPGLVRSIEADFGQTDAGIGLLYLLSAVSYAAGTFGGGFLTERLGRRGVLSGAAVALSAGLLLEAGAPTWVAFAFATVPVGIGLGIVDGGMNSLVLDLSRRRPGGALNLLHLFFSLGAAGSPFVVGRLVSAGVEWRGIVAATGVAALLIAALLGTQRMPSGRVDRSTRPSLEAVADGRAGRRSVLPFLVLALAIALYVSAEVGVSSWVVRFLSSSSVDAATGTLAAFWGCLTVSRLLAARVADRFPPAAFAAVCAFCGGAALLAAVASPSPTLAMILFAACGFAFGPVYPMIMSIGGLLFPRRLAAVTGGLAGSAVIGGIVYPPLMGVISEAAGIPFAMVGAAALAVACAGTLVIVGLTSGSGRPS